MQLDVEVLFREHVGFEDLLGFDLLLEVVLFLVRLGLAEDSVHGDLAFSQEVEGVGHVARSGGITEKASTW